MLPQFAKSARSAVAYPNAEGLSFHENAAQQERNFTTASLAMAVEIEQAFEVGNSRSSASSPAASCWWPTSFG